MALGPDHRQPTDRSPSRAATEGILRLADKAQEVIDKNRNRATALTNAGLIIAVALGAAYWFKNWFGAVGLEDQIFLFFGCLVGSVLVRYMLLGTLAASAATFWLQQRWTPDSGIYYVLIWLTIWVAGHWLQRTMISALSTTQAARKGSSWWKSVWYWAKARSALREAFAKPSERKAAARSVRATFSNLKGQEVDSFQILYYAIPAVVLSVKSAGELARALRSLEAFVSELKAKGINLKSTLILGVPAAAASADAPDEFTDYLALATRLATRGIDPEFALLRGIPATVPAAQKLLGRRAVLEFLETLIVTLRGRRINPGKDLADAIFEVSSVARTPAQLQEFLALAISLAAEGIDPAWTLHNGIPAVVTLATNDEERMAYLALAKRLADKGIDPASTLHRGVPAVAPIAKSPGERESLLATLEEFAAALAAKKLPWSSISEIPATAAVSTTTNELRIYLGLGIRLAGIGIDPDNILQHAIPAVSPIGKASGQLEGVLEVLETFVTEAAKQKLKPRSLLPAIRVVAGIAKTPDELQGYLALATGVADRLARNGISLETTWDNGIPKAISTASTRDDLVEALERLERSEMERLENEQRAADRDYRYEAPTYIINGVEVKYNGHRTERDPDGYLRDQDGCVIDYEAPRDKEDYPW